MDSLTFTPGDAFLASDSTTVPWTVVFEDEGATGYFYACDRSFQTQEQSIMDAMLIYNVSAIGDPSQQRIASVQWSHDGLQAVLYVDGTPQALYDFAAKIGMCRSNFPNFLDEDSNGWRKNSHQWVDAIMERFEAQLYKEA